MDSVLGMTIPDELTKLFAAGTLASKDWRRLFVAKAGLREKLADIWFIPPARMEHWMAELRSFRAEVGADEYARTFMIRSSAELHSPVGMPYADIDRGLPLADYVARRFLAAPT